MAIAEEVEIERGEEISDEEFIENLVDDILPKVHESLEFKRARTKDIETPITDDSSQPMGGNIERQQISGLAVIEDLEKKLLMMQESQVDLANIDYPCLERVLSFLARRGDNYQNELARLQELKIKNGRKN